MRATPRLTSAFALAVAASAVACAHVPHDPGVRLDDPARAESLAAALAASFPGAFTAMHRVLLDVGGRELVLEGYLAVADSGDLRLVAKGPFGATLWDAEQKGGAVTVLQKQDFVDEAWITRYALRDARVVHALERARPATLVTHADGSVGLAWALGEGEGAEYVLASDGALRAYVRFGRGEVVYRAVFSDVGPIPGLGRDIWRAVRVEDFAAGYVADIQLVAAELAQAAAE